MDTVTLAQWIGWLAAGFGFIAMSRKEERSVKLWLLVHTFFYGLHFHLLGLPFAVAANGIAFARIGISIYSRSWLWVFLLSGLSVAAGLVPMSGEEPWHAYLPLVASVLLCVTLFRLRGAPFRLGLLLGSLLWLLHNFWAGSYGGCALEAGMCLSTMIGWYRSCRINRGNCPQTTNDS